MLRTKRGGLGFNPCEGSYPSQGLIRFCYFHLEII